MATHNQNAVDKYVAARKARVEFDRSTQSNVGLLVAATLAFMVLGAFSVKIIANVKAENVGVLTWNWWQLGTLGAFLFIGSIAMIALADMRWHFGFIPDLLLTWRAIRAFPRKAWDGLVWVASSPIKVWRWFRWLHKVIHIGLLEQWDSAFGRWYRHWHHRAIHRYVHYLVLFIALVATEGVWYGAFAPRIHTVLVEPAPAYSTVDITTDNDFDAALDQESIHGLRVDNGALKLETVVNHTGHLIPVASGSFTVMDGTSPDNVWTADPSSRAGDVLQWDGTKIVVHHGVTKGYAATKIKSFGPDAALVFCPAPVNVINVHRWNGLDWSVTSISAPITVNVDDVWGSGLNDITVDVRAGTYHWDGKTWEAVAAQQPKLTKSSADLTGGVLAVKDGVLYRQEGAGITYRPSGEAIMKLTPRPGCTNKWLGAAPVAITTNGATIALQYSDSRDGAWHDNIKDVPASETLFVRVRLSTTDTHSGLPVLTEFGTKYEPLAQTKE